MKKEYCCNCRSEISQLNWRIGNFRCKKCYGEEVEIDKDKLVEEVIKVLNYKYNLG